MTNFNDIMEKYIKGNSPNWPQISDHTHGTLIISSLRFRKTNFAVNLVNDQPNINKMYHMQDSFMN